MPPCRGSSPEPGAHLHDLISISFAASPLPRSPCCELQRDIDEYENQEALLQEGVLRFIATRMDEFEEDENQENVTNPPEAATGEVNAAQAYDAFKVFKRTFHCLLMYTKLRRNLHIDCVKSCSREAQSRNPITSEQRDILSIYSPAPEYQIHARRNEIEERHTYTSGVFIMGFFELLNLELGVTASVRTAMYQVVSLVPVEGREMPALPEGLHGIRRRRRQEL
ncbi:hypothetical protein EJ07DRAFT_153688 [Lizonia empirigonia]|nr:hypothetical protein EJ07DRAFT_153688 [Lizonia empirigonia]